VDERGAAIELRYPGGDRLRAREGRASGRAISRARTCSDDLIEVGERFIGGDRVAARRRSRCRAQPGASEHRDVIQDLLAKLGARSPLRSAAA
jgi:hypothetical protein